MIVIDGSQGEGGGQVLRSSLSLAGCTGRSFVLNNIRKKRRKPGLMRQHLTCVKAAAQICGAQVEGAEIGSKTLRFEPQHLSHAGKYVFPIGSAGSTTLVLQTALPMLGRAAGVSHVVVSGGTHNPMAPPFDFLEQSFAPQLRRLGFGFDVAMSKIGFVPVGGGQIEAVIEGVEGPSNPGDALTEKPAFELLSRGKLLRRHARIDLAGLPRHIAERELAVVQKKLALFGNELSICEHGEALGTGNVVSIVHEFEHVTHVATGFGEVRVRAEAVASKVSGTVRRFLASEDVPVGEHLADQLLLPMALAGGGTFRTLEPTLHTRTNATIVERFTGVEIRFVPDGLREWKVTVGG